MSGEAEKRQRELEVMLTLSFQFIQRLGAWVIHCLPNWAVSVKKGSAYVLSYPSKQSGIHQVDSQKKLKREISFQKPFSNNGSWGRVRNGMEMRQEGTQRGGRQGLMSEWNIMDDRNCDTPDGKNRHVHVRDLTDLQRHRQDTSHLSSLIDIQWENSREGNTSQRWQVSA